jgi:hypothetical protein
MATDIECSLNCKHLLRSPWKEYGICSLDKITLKLWILMDAGKGSKRGQECLNYEPMGKDGTGEV